MAELTFEELIDEAIDVVDLLVYFVDEVDFTLEVNHKRLLRDVENLEL